LALAQDETEGFLAPPAIPNGVRLAGFELKLGNFVGGIPTLLRAKLDSLVTDADAFGELSVRERAMLGYRSVDLSSTVDLAWNENGKVFRINEISSKGTNMGAASLKATLGNVPRELFAGTLPQMQVTALGVTLSELSLHLENAGPLG
jgi:hypothetical protein